MTEILLDNYTLQGSYAYLEMNQRGDLYKECLSHLIESIIIYDKIVVPNDVLSINPKCQSVAASFPDVIVGRSMTQTPDIHHHIIDKKIVDQFRPILVETNPFAGFETREAVDIEEIGYPEHFSPPGYMGRDEWRLSFAERQTYYTWYCLKLASAFGLNYAPNPMRAVLLQNEEIMRVPVFPNFSKDILKYFEIVRQKHKVELRKVFPSLPEGFPLPLVLNYVRTKAKDNRDIVAVTWGIRDSKEAKAYRRLCSNLEEAYQNGDQEEIDGVDNEIKDLGDRWSESLCRTKATKRWSIKYGIIGTDFETPWVNIKATDRKLHFVFVHNLLLAGS
jgi:hypothetical protein